MIWLLRVALAQEEQLTPEDIERAKILFEQGEALYAQAKYDEAAAAFKLSYALSKRPLLLFNMAACYERIYAWEDALETLQEYRPFATAEEVGAIDIRIARAQQQVDKQREQERLLAEAQRKASEPPPPAPTAPPPKRVKPVPVALFSVGALAAASGTFFTVQTLDARGDWTALCVEGADDRLCPAAAGPLVRRDNTSGLAADLSWLVTAGALTAGFVVAF